MTMTQTTMAMEITERQSPIPSNAKHIKGYKMKSNNLIIGSEKLFSKNNKYGFNDLFKEDHDIRLVFKDGEETARNIAPTVHYLLESDYKHKTFIGCNQDAELLFDLCLDHNITFDAAVLINCRYSNYFRVDNSRLVKKLQKKTKIFNLHGRLYKNETLPFAQENQYIPTILSPSLSSRYSLEAYGLLVYGVYQQNYLDSVLGRVSSL